MNEKISDLKNLILEYEELSQELEQMNHDWDYGSPEEAAMADPSDQFMKEQELEQKYYEIKEFMEEL